MLQKQNISIPVNSALDTKSDPFLTDAQTALTQENVRFYQAGALVKRPGFEPLGTIPGAAAKRLVSDNKQIFALRGPGEEQCLGYFDGWRSLTSSQGYGSINGIQLKALEFFGGEAYTTGAWHDYYDGVHAIVTNQYRLAGSDGAQYPEIYIYDGSNYRALTTSGVFPVSAPTDFVNTAKCAWITDGVDNFLVVAAIRNDGSNNIDVVIYNQTLGSSVYYNSDALAAFNGKLAICYKPDRSGCFVAARNGVNSYYIAEINSTGIINQTSVTTVSNISSVIDMACNATQVAVLTVKTSDNYPEITTTNYSFVTQWTQTGTSGALSLGTIGLVISGGIVLNSANSFTFGYSTRITSTFTVTTSCWLVDSLGFVERGRDFSVALLSRPYDDGTQTIQPVFSYPNSISTGAIGNDLFSSVGIMRIDNNDSVDGVRYIGAGFYERNYITGLGFMESSLQQTTTGKLCFFALEPLRATFNSVLSSTLQSSRATLCEIDLNNSDAQYGLALNLGDSLLSMDGKPSYIDGSRQVGIGTHYRPFITGTTSTTGGTLAAGTYLVKLIFQTIDSQGNILYSQESNQLSLTTTGGTSSIALNLRLSKWYGFCTVQVYMTRVNGSSLQLRETRVADVSSANFSYTITSSPSATAPLIYTTGGVLEHSPPPPALHSSVHQDRVFVIPADEFDKVYYSNKYIAGEIPSFSNLLFIQLANSASRYRDKLTGCSSLGDKLIIFRENSIYWTAGDGANLLGVNSSFTEPEVLGQDIGCTNPKSIILTPVGVMFQSEKGIYLIDAGLSLNYVGAAVEQYNSEDVIDSCMITKRNIVLMLTSSRILCFDYLLQRWSVDSVSGLSSLAIWNNKIVALKTSGAVSIESTLYTDNFGEMTPPSVQMKLVTGWMKLTGIQDYGRTWRVLVLGRWKSNHTLTVKAYYDYDDSTVETYLITASSTPGLYQYNIHLKRQKCEALKLELFDTGTGQSLDLVSLTLEVGVKKGTMKVPAARKL